jgi:inorganic triphosphatase YgiF
MSTEIELKLSLKPKAVAQLLKHPLLSACRPEKQRLLNTYYDTPKLHLHARQTAMRFRKKGWQWLLTVKTAEPASGGLALRNEWETAATPGNFDFSHVDRSELRHFLEEASPQLGAIFTTDFRRRTWQISFGESVIELAIDQGLIESGKKSEPICEVELELVSGQVSDIFGLARSLQEVVSLRPAIASKAERGYRLFSGEAMPPFRAQPTTLTGELTPVEAFRCIALNCLEHFQRNEQGLISSDDPEFVHQARVAMRRLRSALKLFRSVLPADFVEIYGQTWASLSRALGDARNWDVLITETLPPIHRAFHDNRDVKSLRAAGERLSRRARKAIVSMLGMPEYPRLMTEFTAAVFAIKDILPQSLTEFARNRLDKDARQARRLAHHYAVLSAAERHQMRLKFKRLRYSLEFFGPLFPRKKLQPYLAVLSQLQDELGLINDHVTAEILVNDVLKKNPAGPIHGWVSGRHELLVGALHESLDVWLATPCGWK